MNKFIILVSIVFISCNVTAQDQMSDLEFGMLLIKTADQIDEKKREIERIRHAQKNKEIDNLVALCKSTEKIKDIIKVSNNLLETERFKKDPSMQEQKLELAKQTVRYEAAVENINILFEGEFDQICHKLEK